MNKEIYFYKNNHFKSNDWQSELGISNTQAINQIKKMTKSLVITSFKKEAVRLFFWFLAIIMFVTLAFAVVQNLFSNNVKLYSIPLVAGIICCIGLHFGKFKHTNQPSLKSLLPKNFESEVNLLLTYYDNFLRSQQPAYRNIGKEGYGTILSKGITSSNFGILAIIGTRWQRYLIDNCKEDLTGEWWFPRPELLINFNTGKTNRISIIKAIITHPNDKVAENFLVRISALAGNEVQKSKTARIRWVEIIRATRESRHLNGKDEREKEVNQKLQKKNIDLKPVSPVKEISRYYTFRSAEAAFRNYLEDPHLQTNSLAKQLLTQLTQSS